MLLILCSGLFLIQNAACGGKEKGETGPEVESVGELSLICGVIAVSVPTIRHEIDRVGKSTMTLAATRQMMMWLRSELNLLLKKQKR